MAGSEVVKLMRRAFIIFLPVLLLFSGCNIQKPSVDLISAPEESQQLLIYTSHKKEVYEPIILEFEHRTGIWVEVVTGETIELLKKIAAGDTECDLIFGGGVDSLRAYSDNFSEYISPELKNVYPKARGNGMWTPFSLLPVVLVYNPKLVLYNPPDSWSCLLDPAWKGKIAFADPTVSGSGYTALVTMIQALNEDHEEIIEAFYENLDGRILADSEQVIEAVAQAEEGFYVGVTLEDAALKSIKAGYDITMVYPREGSSIIPDGAALVKNSPHEENAKRFLDFILSRDVQQRLADDLSRRPVITGIPVTDLSTGEHFELKYDIDWASGHLSEILKHWEILKEVYK